MSWAVAVGGLLGGREREAAPQGDGWTPREGARKGGPRLTPSRCALQRVKTIQPMAAAMSSTIKTTTMVAAVFMTGGGRSFRRDGLAG